MKTAEYVYWKDKGEWLGYVKDYPEFWTQGKSLEDLKAHLRDLSHDLRLSSFRAFC